MFKSKSQVDRHVSNVLNQIRDPKERNIKGLAFASLYFKINEHDTALKHLQGFLSVKETYASAHKLLGQIYEAQKQPEKAFAAYKRSLELDENQKDVLKKVCEMCLAVNASPEVAQYWVDRAEKYLKGDTVILSLREKVYSGRGKTGTDSSDLEELLAEQLVRNPRDVRLRCRLIRHLLERGRVSEAYDHMTDVENTEAYQDSLEWYHVVRDVLEEYIEKSQAGSGEISVCRQSLLTCLCHITSLSLQHSTVSDSVLALYRFDSALCKFQEFREISESWNTLHLEMQAQLFYFVGTLLLKKALSGDLTWSEARVLAAGCYGVTVNVEPFSCRSAWYSQDGERRRKTYDTWHRAAVRRYVTAGFLLDELSTGAGFLSALQTETLIHQVQQRIVRLVYTQPDMRHTASQTYLATNTVFTSVTLAMPNNSTMTDMERELYNNEVNNLAFIVWLAVNHRQEPEFERIRYNLVHFEGLFVDNDDLKHCSLQTLSQLDIQTFLRAVVWDSVIGLEENVVDPNRPIILPPEIAPPVCRKEQSDWWTAACKLVNSKARIGEDWSLLQRTLQRGLDEMHLIGNHTMCLSLLLYLARSYQRPEDSVSEMGRYEEMRATFYWNAALEMITRVKKQRKIWTPQAWLFRSEPLKTPDERDVLIKESEAMGRMFLARIAEQQGKMEEALERYSKIDTAEASYHQAKIYRRMAAESAVNEDREFLEQAREALCLTLDRLRGDRHNPLHHEVTEMFDSVETRLNRSQYTRDATLAEPETSTRLEVEPPHSTPRSVRRSLYPALGSGGRQEIYSERSHVAASPERLDAQLRVLTLKQETDMNSLRELVKGLQEKIEDLTQEMAELKTAVRREAQAPPPEPAPAAAAAAAPAPQPVIAPPPPAAPHPPQIGVPYYGYPLREFEFPSPQAYPPGYSYAMAVPPSAWTALHPGYGALGNIGMRPPPPQVHPSNLVPPQQQHHDTYDDEEDYHDHDLVDQNDWHQPPDTSQRPVGGQPGFPAAGLNTQADASNMPAPGFFSTPAGRSQMVRMMGSTDVTPGLIQQPGPQRPPLIGGSGAVTAPVATRFPLSMPQPTVTQTQAVSQPAVIADPPVSKPAGDIVSATPVISSAAQTVTPATDMLRSMVSQVGKSSQPAAGVANTTPSCSKASNTVGGFVFSGKPPPVNEEKKSIPVSQPQVSKANPFSNFTFGSPAPVPLTSQSPAAQSTSPVKPLVTHVRTPGKSPVKPGSVVSPGGEGHEDHFEPNVDFKPVVQLPEKVDLKTGEENEEKLFGERAKLYRQDGGQWKERGKGELKILSDKTTGKSRIVMRRDQVLKLCANHVITADMELKPLTNTENAVCWFAQDYSEEEVKNESLAAKFLSADNVARFKEVFESCRKKISLSDSAKEITAAPMQKEPQSLAELLRRDDQLECSVGMVSNDKSMDKPAVKPPEPAAAPFSFGAPKDSQKQSLADMFKAKSGQWDCDTCMVRNEDSTTVCPACQTVRPGFTKPESKPATSSFSMGGFTFGKVSGPVTFGAVAAPPQASPSDTGKAADSKPAFTFGAPNKAGEEKQGFQFGGSSGFRFGSSPSVSKPQTSVPVDLSVKTTPAVNVTSTTETAKPALGSGTFSFTPAKSTSAPAVTSPQSPEGGYYVNKEGDDDHITFEPIIQLPDKVDLKTGEEDEEILFMERAKLLRFVGKEWKERGVGEVKLLQHRASNKVRVVMRREKVHKLCLNHAVNDSIDLQALPNGKGKAWTWHADDFSDGEEPVHETFAIRFITEEAANRFKAVFDKAKEMKPPAQEKRGSLLEKLLAPSTDENDSDIEFLEEVKPNQAKIEEARQYKLPDTFFNYENNPDCVGCIGCIEPPFDFSKIGQAGAYAYLVSRQPGAKNKSEKAKTEPVTTVSDIKTATSSPLVFGGSSGLVDFASLATNTDKEKGFAKKSGESDFKWAGVGSTVFGSPARNQDNTDHQDDDDTHYEPDVDFAPVVTLPEVTDLKTGEEEEEVIFKNRAILYRFDLGMWKEKGRGEIKLLKHTSTGQSRLLMRREQVLKVACNHRLTPDMSLEKLATSETAWCWFAVDYAEDEAKNEQFAVKFKNKAIAEEFKTHFDACKVDQESSPKKDTAGSGDGKPVTTKQSTDADGKPAKTSDVSSTTSTADKPSGFTPAGPELFSTPATSAGPALFTAPTSSAGPGLFTKPSASAGPGMFAAPATSAGPGLFGAPATSAGSGLFAAPATSAGTGLFAAPATSAGPGLFGAQATSAGPGLFAAPATSAGTGLFAAPATSAGTGLFAAPATSAGTGLFAAPATSAGTGLFAAPPSSAGPGLFTKPSASAGPGLFHVDNKTSETTQIGTENKGPGPFSSKSDSQISGVASDITPAQDTGSFAAKPTQSDSSSGFSFKLPVESVGPKSTAFSFQSLSGNTAGQATETKANAPPFSFTASPGVFGASRKTTGEADDEEEDDEDVEDGSVVFSKRVTLLSCPADEDTVQLLGQGELEMVYGENTKPQIYAENDEGLILCDHTIEPHSTASIDKKSVTWTAEDENAVPPGDTRFTAKFSSQAAASEFISCFNDAVGIASQFSEHYQAEVEDLGPQEEDDEEEEPLFICTASLSVLKDGTQKERGEGQLKVVHDDDVAGCRVFMETSNLERMVNHIVCRQHNPLVMDSELSVMWTAKDFSTDEPVKQSFKVTFNSEDDRVAFVQTFEQARLMAAEAELDEL